MKKIAFYTDSIFSYGGVQRVLAVIATALSEDNEVTVITREPQDRKDLTMYGLDKSNINYIFVDDPESPKSEFFLCKAYSYCYKKLLHNTDFEAAHWLYSRSSLRPTQRRNIISIINEGRFDLVIGVHAFLSIHLASVASELNCKVLGWMHNSYEALFTNKNAYLPGLDRFFSHSMRKMNGVVVLSKSDKERFEEKLGLTTTCIYNPLTVAPLGVSSHENKRFLSVGRMEDGHKGFDILIRAFAKFQPSHPDWELEIVGEGCVKPQLESLIAKLEMEDHIHIRPFTNTIQKHYMEANAYVLSSRWEGFALVMVEALSHGLPIIATRLPATEEVFEGESFAHLCINEDVNDFAEALTLFADSDLKQMGDAAKQFSDHFSVSAATEQWKQLIDSL